MKKFILLMLLMLSACNVGELEPKRERLHTMGNDICKASPEKCINGIPW